MLRIVESGRGETLHIFEVFSTTLNVPMAFVQMRLYRPINRWSVSITQATPGEMTLPMSAAVVEVLVCARALAIELTHIFGVGKLPSPETLSGVVLPFIGEVKIDYLESPDVA
jgi:hypothetical protein